MIADSEVGAGNHIAVLISTHEGLIEWGTNIDEMGSTFEDRRNALLELLNDREIEMAVPEGAFYLMVPVAEDDQTWCETALEEAPSQPLQEMHSEHRAMRDSAMQRAKNGPMRQSLD